MKPKVFINKENGEVTIIFDKSVDPGNCNVVLVHDGERKQKLFGNRMFIPLG